MHKKTTLFFIGLGIMAALGAYFIQVQGQTTEVVLFLSPASGAYQTGDIFGVEIRLNTDGQRAVTAKAYLNYDTGKLKAVQISALGSVFEEVVNNKINVSAGLIEFSGYRLSPYLSGQNLLLGTVIFEAVSPGQTAVNFNSSDFVVEPSRAENILTSTTGAAYTISQAVEPEPSPTTTPPIIDPVEEEETIYSDGVLLKGSGPKIYLIEGGQKRWITSPEAFIDPDAWSSIVFVAESHLALYPDGPNISPVTLIRAQGDDKVYAVANGLKRHIVSVEVFNSYNFQWSAIDEVSLTELAQYPRVSHVKLADDEKVYYLTEPGFKRHILTAEVFNSYNNQWQDIIVVNQTELDSYPVNDLIRAQGDDRVYKLESGKKRWIKSIEAFVKYNFDWSKIAPVNQTELNSYSLGVSIE